VSLSRCVKEEIEILKGLDSKVINTLMAKIDTIHSFRSLKTFFTTLVQEENHLVRILKACSHYIITPAYSQLKKSLGKDYKDTLWNISVQFFTHFIVTKHTILSVFNSSDASMEIDWTVTITFDINIQQILSSKVEIVKYSFLSDVSAEKKHQVLESLASLITPDTREQCKLIIPISQVIGCLAGKLSLLEEDELQISGLLPDNTKISALELLNIIQETLKSSHLSGINTSK
jgi:hypothetical protein